MREVDQKLYILLQGPYREVIVTEGMDPLIHSDRVLTDMIVLTLKRNALCMHVY